MSWLTNGLQDWWSNQYLSNMWNGYGGDTDQYNTQGLPPLSDQAAFPTYRSQWLFGPDGAGNPVDPSNPFQPGNPFPQDPANPFQSSGLNNTQPDTEENKPKFEKASLRDIDATMEDFATNYSSAHGLPNIYLATNVFARVFWTLILLAALGGYIYTMQKLIRSFIEFNVATEVQIYSKTALDFPAVTVCNTNRVRRSQVIKSRHKQLIFIDDLTPLPYYIPCAEGDFQCFNGELCVRSYLVCDGINHCQDFSDEFDCYYGNCGPTQFKCNNGSSDGYCIDNNLACNRWPNCYDGEDEWDCDCKENEFKCTERGGCIKRSAVCDGYWDCLDSSDELKCPNCTLAENDAFICGTTADSIPTGTRARECIWNIFLCDGHFDCSDESDESEYACTIKPEPEAPECTETQFDCGSNGTRECIEVAYVCDNTPDCSNFMDESTETCGERNVRCADNEFLCLNGFECLHSADRCNFYPDCDNDPTRGDERNCTCVSNSGDGTPLQNINCNTYISETDQGLNWNYLDDTSSGVSCHHENWPVDESTVWNLEFECGGLLTCADIGTQLVETCTSVLSDCYVNSNGADYKGRVSETISGTACVTWDTSLSQGYGYTEDRFPLLGQHNMCRNPGGYKSAPWCFIVENGDWIDGVEPPDETAGDYDYGGNVAESEFITEAEVTLDQPFDLALEDPNSPEFQLLANQVEAEMANEIQGEFPEEFDGVEVTGFSEGSVISVCRFGWNAFVLENTINTVVGDIVNSGRLRSLRAMRDSFHIHDHGRSGSGTGTDQDPYYDTGYGGGDCQGGFQCDDYMATCIPIEMKCDGTNDCINGDDEDPMICTTGYGCTAQQFECNDGTCIDIALTCNGVAECMNEEDENPNECQGGGTTGCTEEQFACHDGSCIDIGMKCDGMPDCMDAEDEETTLCAGTTRRKRRVIDIINASGRRRPVRNIKQGKSLHQQKKRAAEGKIRRRRRKRQAEAGQGTQWQYCNVPSEDQRNTCHFGITFDDTRLDGERLEILHDGQWGTISSTSWGINEANVACRMLGLGTANDFVVGGFGFAEGPVWISDINCGGEERTLLDCVYTSEAGFYDHTNDVGVICSGFGRKKRETDTETQEDKPLVTDKNEAINSRIKRQETQNMYNLELTFESNDELGMFVDDDLGTFQCGHNGPTIPLWQTCNNYPDCEDGSDEIYCGPRDKLCDLHFRACRLEDECIEPEFECDQVQDCPNHGLDEAFCDITECPDDYWKCPDKPICIPIYSRCDTVNDCGHSEDEENCTNTESAETPNPFEDENWYKPYDKFADAGFFQHFVDEYYQERTFHRVKGEEPVDWKSFFTFSSTADYSDLLEVFKITRKEIGEYGHQQEDFILDCTYEQIECQNFTWFETDTYGNCYTFNFDPSNNNYVSTQTGATNGLRMTLNLQQNEYISLGGREAGVRVTITPPNVRPLPDEDGITIRPGVVTSIALRFENISRLGGLYGDCASPERKMYVFDEGEIKESGLEAYDKQVCLRTCLHENIMNYCGCSDTIQLKGPRCHITNTTQDVCKQLIRILHQSDKLDCDCPNQCSTKTYTTTTSTSKWPSNVYREHLLRFIHAINPKSTSNINDRESIGDNLVRLEVFFEQLNYATTKEVAAYTTESLISDVGGTAGLYIGFSFITFLEFGVLIIECCKRFCLRSKQGRGWQNAQGHFQNAQRHFKNGRRRQPQQQPPPGFFPQQFLRHYETSLPRYDTTQF